jgi:carbon-monoxide dehydrogenase medium subunit
MSLPRFEYEEPATLAEVSALLEEHGEEALLIAGGTALVLMMRERLSQPKVLISLTGIPDMVGIRANGAVHIGAMTTHREIERSTTLQEAVPLLSQACGRVASPTIRNMGTLGGSISLGDPAADPAPALLALEAEVKVAGPEGERRVPIRDYLKGFFETDRRPSEVLTGVHVPELPEDARTTFLKYTCSSEEAYAVVSVAAMIVPGPDGTWDDVRIGLGAVALTALRTASAEQVLRGQRPTPELIAEAAEAALSDIDPSGDSQASAGYRREMTRVWVRRALEELLPA